MVTTVTKSYKIKIKTIRHFVFGLNKLLTLPKTVLQFVKP